jgi:DNA polymerase delta subunit 1
MQRSANPNLFTGKFDKPPAFPEEWARPAVGELKDVDFCVIDLDYRQYPHPHATFDTRDSGEVAVIDLHGIDMDGHSVVCHCHNFEPYFYMSIPDGFLASALPLLRTKLNEVLSGSTRNPDIPPVRKVELVDRHSIMHYRGTETERYVKVTTQLPKQVAACRRVLEDATAQVPGAAPNWQCQTYESNVHFVLRFMNDRRLTGCAWATVPAGSYTVRAGKDKRTRSQIEIDANSESVVSHEPDGDWMKIPPLRVLSFDIEVGGEPDHFPTSDKDPVIQICAYMQVLGQPDPMFSVAFVLGTCSPLVGSALFQFDTERGLLSAWHQFFTYIDPDVVTGYNIDNFDWPYLVERAAAIECKEFSELSRYVGEFCEAKESTKQSKLLGKREGKQVSMPGIITFDMMIAVQMDHKLRSYTLNAVSANFLGDQKEDVHYSMISKLQKGTAQDRHRLAVYCVKDAYLPLQLMNKLLSLMTSIELARVCHVPLSFLMDRGQQIRVFCQLLDKASQRGMIIPAVKSSKATEQYEGATVIEPKVGYFRCPIPTLDFASLYPSIMISHNICYSTLLKAGDKCQVDFEMSPNSVRFVKPEVFKGVLPEILRGLLSARKATRAQMAIETDEAIKNVLHCRQLAIKVSANSVYGFSGATTGKLPCLDISETVTAYGRMMIDATKTIVEDRYTVAKGYKHDAIVIYGDTDSVMVNFGDIPLAEAIALGQDAAEVVSQSFPPPIHLEFEKAYQPYLLISKKHYAGLKHMKADDKGTIDAKGIETVRRDNCRLVQNLLQKVLNMLLFDQNVDGAIQFVKSVVSDLLADQIDLSFLVISKALSKKEYKAKQTHVELAERMAKRDPGRAPILGDRIAYVITASGGKSSKAYEKSEDPLFVLEHGLQIDTKYYLDNQLRKPLMRLFTPIMGESRVIGLLEGEHTRHVKRAPVRTTGKATAGSLMGFVQVLESCLCGKAPVKAGEPPVCAQCKTRITEVFQEKLKLYQYAEEQHSKLWTQCQRCQKSLLTPNICTAIDCPIFYRRKRAQLDLEDSYKALKRFDTLK